MMIDRAKVLLCQMYLPQFDEEEKQALTMAITALEELKEYKLKEFQCHLAREEGISIGYNNAIDDFAEKLHGLCGFEIDDIQYPYILHESRIDEIAEQLKAGGTDGNSATDN